MSESTERVMPKGGRKGGAMFPRVNLEQAITYARKLVSKTHTAAAGRDVIYSGVVGTKSGQGNVRISALKQYGFLLGTDAKKYSASPLAKSISSAPEDELTPLLRDAMLKPTVFNKLFETFQGDSVARNKLKQRAADLNVHPDETENCVEIYAAGLVAAKLATLNGDQVNHLSSKGLMPSSTNPDSELLTNPIGESDETTQSSEPEAANGNSVGTSKLENGATSMAKAVFNVNITLDSSLDTEKLQRQLEILKRFGAI